ncbi:sialate O-acetylesterase [Novipirellula caenicola]|uniref:Sialate O-acetylesterase domain-containing protein n=1 Tax=Novipirellula caenicola TaxID=1536901 RepID=A0ABP9VMH3_9BACT
MIRITNLLVVVYVTLGCISPAIAEKPLKIYIMAGQSNMVGTGGISTFDHIGDDPATAPLLDKMLGPDGKPRICDRVWISSLNGKMNQYGGEGFGRLTAGYGVRREDPTKPDDFIGPEYLFGITMEESYDGPILIIKTAWGGQNLCVDYRPPGAGPYVLNDQQVEMYRERGKLDQIRTQRKEATGRNYRYMVEHVRKVLGDIKRVYPDYDPDAGYELSGFVWFQGWNDFVDTATYPDSRGEKQYNEYSELLAQFIRDVRKDLDAPELPFVVGVIGVYGDFTPGTFRVVNQSDRRMKLFRKAMAAPAAMEEFKGSVVAVPTAPFRENSLGFIEQKQQQVQAMGRQLAKKHPGSANADGSMTPEQRKAYLDDYRSKLLTPEEIALWARATSIGGFVHYYGSAKFHAQAGKAFAEAFLEMEGSVGDTETRSEE